MENGKDPELWEIAQKRAGFKSHLTVYIILNIFFWLLWYFGSSYKGNDGLPWAVWPTFGWGIGLLFHYIGAYIYPKNNSVEREYQKLKNNQSSK